MAKGGYFGVGGKAHKIKKGYIGVGGKAHKIKKGYIGVGGKARLCFSAESARFGTFAYIPANSGVIQMLDELFNIVDNANQHGFECPVYYGISYQVAYVGERFFIVGRNASNRNQSVIVELDPVDFSFKTDKYIFDTTTYGYPNNVAGLKDQLVIYPTREYVIDPNTYSIIRTFNRVALTLGHSSNHFFYELVENSSILEIDGITGSVSRTTAYDYARMLSDNSDASKLVVQPYYYYYGASTNSGMQWRDRSTYAVIANSTTTYRVTYSLAVCKE